MDGTTDLLKKWDLRHAEATDSGKPARVLEENLHLFPARCKALDLACGRGVNAFLLAQAGLEVTAWDNSTVAIDRLIKQAEAYGLHINAQVRDVIERPPEQSSFDVILVCHFLERQLAPALIDALRPGGLLYYQTFSRQHVTDNGPASHDYRLKTNELLHLFRPLTIRVYREEGRLGDLAKGWRDLAMLVAQKPEM